jgi:ferredoxin
LIGTLFLLVGVIGSLWLPNNFCRYFCPMGAFLALLSKISPTRIYRNETTCIDCKRCDRVCPAQIDISTQPNVKSAECLSCGDCVNICPVENTLVYKMRNTFPLRWIVYGIAALVIFFGTVFVAKQANLWQTNFANAGQVITDDSGVKNPYLIKGSMTLDSISQEFNVPVEAFLEKFNLPADLDSSQMLKNIAHPNNLEVEAFREFIIEYLQQQNPDLTFEQPATMEDH